jgi:hypothetical protein
MRHIYVGDVGDFGKYGLLRALCGTTYRLGVVWYLTEAQEHNNDGKHDGYLKWSSAKNRAFFRDCDPPLYDELKLIRQKPQLDLSLIEKSSIFDANTAFHTAPVPHFEGRVESKGAAGRRWEVRRSWHADALAAVSGTAVVFLDPDNGIIFDTPSEGTRPSHKHAYFFELRDYIDRGQTVIAYHHLGRQKGGHDLLIQTCLTKLKEAGCNLWGVHYNRGTGRAFFVFPAKEHRKVLLERSSGFARTWSNHARMVEASERITG